MVCAVVSLLRPLEKGGGMTILWIVLVVILVLALLGFFGRGRW
ncbi:MAG: hypothetical protein ACXVZL_10945 [Gaiellaceae bacterium]